MDSEKEPLGSDSEDDHHPDIQISIKKLDGDTFFVSISTTASVQALKSIIHDTQNVEADRQRLIYRAQELRNEVPLSQYGIQSGSTLHLVVRRNVPQQNQVNVEVQEFSALILYQLSVLSVHDIPRKIASSLHFS